MGKEASDVSARILGAAISLFAEQGIEATGMRRIAARAGVSVPTVYHHFDSKQALVHAVFADRFVSYVSPGPALERGPVHQRLSDFCRGLLAALHEQFEFARLVHRESSSGVEEAIRESDVLAHMWRLAIREALAGADDLRADLDLDATAEAVKCALWGAFSVYLTQPDGFDVHASLRAVVDTFGTALSASVRATPAATEVG